MTPEEIWNQALADMRTRLDEVRRSLRDGDMSDLGHITTPTDLPALPAECAEAAQRVADQQRDVEAEVRRHLDAHVTDFPWTPQRPTGVRRTRFDTHA
jgi:hypothetical protein